MRKCVSCGLSVTVDAVEREQMKLLYSEDDSPPMDFDSDEETLLRLPPDSCPPPPSPMQRGLCSDSAHLLCLL